MNTYIRALKYYTKRWGLLLIVAISMLTYSTFSNVSVWLVAPFLNTLFSQGEAVVDEEKLTIDERQKELSQLDEIKLKLNTYTNRIATGDTKEETLFNLCMIILVVFFIKNLSGFIGKVFSVKIGYGVIRELRNELYEHFAYLSLDFFNKNKLGILMSHVLNDVNIVDNSFNQNIITFVRDPLHIVLSLFIIIILSWRLTFFTFIILPISGLIITKIGSSLRRKSKRAQEKIADVTSLLQETIAGIRIVKAFAMESFEISRFQKATRQYEKSMFKKAALSSMASPLTEFLGAGLGAFILWYGGRMVFRGELLSPEDFIRFIIVVFSMMQPIKQIGNLNNKVQEGIAAAQRVFDILDEPRKITNSPNAKTKNTIEKSITFKNVNFQYTKEDTVVLQNINLAINVNEVVALVGPSGAGKSTLVDLICRFYDPTDGEIDIDEIDLREIEIKSLRNMIGFVTQDPILFNDSIKNNIAYGSDVDEKNLIIAAKAANAHDFIQNLPEGYDTNIGDRGVLLSGGEKQRVSIARAIYKNPPILIFDEATSSLDSQSEQLVQQAIERLIQNRTSVIIAHRMSTIRNADKIVVLEKGKVVGIGPHEELMVDCPLYRKLYNLQFQDSLLEKEEE